jgi:hypothetical protein
MGAGLCISSVIDRLCQDLLNFSQKLGLPGGGDERDLKGVALQLS